MLMLDAEQQPSEGSTAEDEEQSEGHVGQMEQEDESSNGHTPGQMYNGVKTSSRKTMQCQVQGCTADLLAEGKPYLIKKRLCTEHMKADAVLRKNHGDQEWRFCFQCGKLELLSLFDGNRRSCRVRLQKRRQPPKRSSTWSPSSFGKPIRQHSNMKAMTLEQWPEVPATDVTEVDDEALLQMQLQQQRHQLQHEHYMQHEMELGMDDSSAMQQQLLTARTAAVAAPVDASVLRSLAARSAPRGQSKHNSRAIAMACSAIQGRLAAFQALNPPGSTDLVDMLPASSTSILAATARVPAATAAAAAAPGTLGSPVPNLPMPEQLTAVQQLQPTVHAAAAAAASMVPVQTAASSVSWPAAVHGGCTAANTAAIQPVTVQAAAAAAAAAVGCMEDDVDACLELMLQEFAGLDGMGHLDGMAVDADPMGADTLGPRATTAGTAFTVMQPNVNGMLASHFGPLQHMHSLANSSLSAATLAGSMAQGLQQHGRLLASTQMAGPAADACVMSGGTSLQHALPGSGGEPTSLCPGNMLHYQPQSQQQQKLQQLQQDIVNEQQRLLQLIHKQSQQLEILQQQEAKAMTNRLAGHVLPTATADDDDTSHSSNDLFNTTHAAADQRLQTMQSVLQRTRWL